MYQDDKLPLSKYGEKIDLTASLQQAKHGCIVQASNFHVWIQKYSKQNC